LIKTVLRILTKGQTKKATREAFVGGTLDAVGPLISCGEAKAVVPWWLVIGSDDLMVLLRGLMQERMVGSEKKSGLRFRRFADLMWR